MIPTRAFSHLKNQRGFGLIEVMVAASLMSVVALGITSFMTQNNKNVLGLRTVSSRDQLKAIMYQSLSNGSILSKSADFLGTSSPLALNQNRNGAGNFYDCLWNQNCPNTFTDFVLVDTDNHPLSGGFTASTGNNTVLYSTDGTRCDTQSPTPLCPIAVGTHFKGNCTGPSPCSASSIAMEFTIYQASSSLDAGPTLKKFVSNAITFSLPFNPSSPYIGSAFRVATFDAVGALTYATNAYAPASGNIGIGTNTPATIFHVQGDTTLSQASGTATRLMMNATNAANTVSFQQAGANRWALNGSNWGGGTDDFEIDRYDNAGTLQGANLLLQRSSGNVGIGTSTPNAPLQVNSSGGTGTVQMGPWSGGASSGSIYLNGAFSTPTSYNLVGGATDLWINRPNGGAMHFRENNGADQLTIAAGGATTLSGDSTINGTLGVKGPNGDPGNYALYVNGSIEATGNVYGASDARLKKKVEPIEDALDKILKVRGVSYYWKDANRPQTRQLGVIAQDVEKVFPEVVKTGKEGLKAVDYEHLVGPLIEAIRELKNSNDDLRKEVGSLRSELDHLKVQKK